MAQASHSDVSARAVDHRSIVQMKTWLEQDFPDHVDILLQLSLDGSERQPLLYDQVEVALDCFRPQADRLEPSIIEDLHAGYVYLVAAIFCMDALVDEHPRGVLNSGKPLGEIAKAGYLFLTGGLLRIKRSAMSAGLSADAVDKELSLVIAENMSALTEEKKLHEKPFEPRLYDDYPNVVGRANILLYLFSLVGQMTGISSSPSMQSALSDFIFFLQMGDDLGDWREDYANNRPTSFIRECLNCMGGQPTIEQLEEFVYLTGIYERRYALIINGLEKVLATLKTFDRPLPKLIAYVEMQRDLSHSGLTAFVREKLF